MEFSRGAKLLRKLGYDPPVIRPVGVNQGSNRNHGDSNSELSSFTESEANFVGLKTGFVSSPKSFPQKLPSTIAKVTAWQKGALSSPARTYCKFSKIPKAVVEKPEVKIDDQSDDDIPLSKIIKKTKGKENNQLLRESSDDIPLAHLNFEADDIPLSKLLKTTTKSASVQQDLNNNKMLDITNKPNFSSNQASKNVTQGQKLEKTVVKYLSSSKVKHKTGTSKADSKTSANDKPQPKKRLGKENSLIPVSKQRNVSAIKSMPEQRTCAKAAVQGTSCIGQSNIPTKQAVLSKTVLKNPDVQRKLFPDSEQELPLDFSTSTALPFLDLSDTASALDLSCISPIDRSFVEKPSSTSTNVKKQSSSTPAIPKFLGVKETVHGPTMSFSENLSPVSPVATTKNPSSLLSKAQNKNSKNHETSNIDKIPPEKVLNSTSDRGSNTSSFLCSTSRKEKSKVTPGNETMNTSALNRSRPQRKTVRPDTYADSDEDADDFSAGSEDDDWTEWIADNDPIMTRDHEADSDSDCSAGSDTEQIPLTLPKNQAKASWTKTMTKTSKPKNKKQTNVIPEEDNAASLGLNDLYWLREDIFEADREPVLIPAPSEILKDPIDYFLYFYDTDLLENAVQHTNTFALWKSGGVKGMDFTVNELKKFLGIWMYMGVLQLPAIRDYWSADTNVPQVSQRMSFNRFQTIKSSLHFYDKTLEHTLDPLDRFAKVRTFLDHMKMKCNDLEQEADYSIDEAMVPYKGKFAGSLRQYIGSKPHKFGIKIFHLAGASGLIYDFIPYSGASTFYNVDLTDEENAMGLGAKIVVHLCKSIVKPHLKSVFFDNFFSGVQLVDYLKKEMNLIATGTIRSNRLDGCVLKSDKELKKAGRGTYDAKSRNGVQITKWMDSKCVHVVSSHAGVEPVGLAQRYDKVAKKAVSVPCPRVIQLYNSKMGGVDLNDMLVEIHRSPTRSRRWYMCLIGYFTDVAVVNSWLIYKRHAKSLGIDKLPIKSSKLFRLSISKALMACEDKRPVPIVKNVIKTPRGYRPDAAVRFDCENHWPSFETTQSRCKFCKDGFTTIICAKCNVNLCFRPTRQCFNSFHLEM